MQRNVAGDDGPYMEALELRLRVYEATSVLTGEIELAADQILATAEDPDVRRNAHLWKMTAVPALQRAAFQPDPLAALADTWAYVIQTRTFLEEGGGRSMFGEQQPVAVEAAGRLEAMFSEHVATLVGVERRDLSEATVRDWAARYPMEDLTTRPSTVQELAPVIASDGVKGLAAVADMNAQLSDLSTRLAIWMEMLPKQARWQVDLVNEDLASGEAGRQLVERGGEEARAVLRDELDHFLVAAEGMARDDVLLAVAALEQERERIQGDLAAERDVLLAAVERERRAILAAVREERILTLEQAEEIADRLVARTNTPIREAIDHLILRLAQLLAGGALLVGLAMLARRRFGASPQA